jgi:hypothetical protein
MRWGVRIVGGRVCPFVLRERVLAAACMRRVNPTNLRCRPKRHASTPLLPIRMEPECQSPLPASPLSTRPP